MKAVLGTRKGVILVEGQGENWKISQAHFDGVKVSYVKVNPYNGDIWAGVNHGHWGPKLHLSQDGGVSFKELAAPQFPKSAKESLKDFWAIEFDPKGRIWLGVEPAALFSSDDEGKTWQFCDSFYQMEGRENWFGGGTDATCLHSILLHPDHPDEIGVGISCAGYIVSHDRAQSWKYSSKGMKAEFLPDPDSAIGQDPHKIIRAKDHPDVLWMQNHCGIYRSEDNGQNWIDLSQNQGLISKFGWDIACDEKNHKVAYTVPALSDEIRVPVDHALCVQKTEDGGKTWTVHRQGLPQENCYDICYRHALSLKDGHLIFGTTTGNLFYSKDQGESWSRLFSNLPPVFSLEWIGE